MFEIIVLLLVMSVWVVLFAFNDVDLNAKFKIPEDSVLRRHFLTQLKAEIETSSNWYLKRRYQKLVAAELKSN